jgi:hypothetical protein
MPMETEIFVSFQHFLLVLFWGKFRNSNETWDTIDTLVFKQFYIVEIGAPSDLDD